MTDAPATYWRRRARRTAWRHNLGCVLGGSLPLCLGVSAVFACVLLTVRENDHGVKVSLWGGYALALLVCAAVAWWRARRRFFTVEDALNRLDWNLGLHNRLGAAAAGVGAFPAARPAGGAPDGYAFRWRRITLAPVVSAALVCAAAWIPVTRHVSNHLPVTPPLAWTQTAGWIDALKKADTLQEPALEDLRERLEQLRQQPTQDWYSQSSLEAGDNLHEQTAQSMQSLQRDLQSASGALEDMQKFTDGTSPAEMQAAHENLANALKGLALGNLPLNHELLDQLKQADVSRLKSLSPEQIEALKHVLKAGSQVCQACLHPGEMEGKLACMALVAERAGPGGKGGGTSHPPLNLSAQPTDLGTKTAASVSNPNLDHALPGDLLGVGKGEHAVDPEKYTGPTSGGAVASNGEGGEAVWRNDLTPAEREVVKNFFK